MHITNINSLRAIVQLLLPFFLLGIPFLLHLCDRILEVLKGCITGCLTDHNDGDIVEAPPIHDLPEDLLDTHRQQLVDGQIPILEDLDSLPHHLHDILGLHLIEHTVRAQNYEVVVGLDIEVFYLGLHNDDLGVPAELLVLRLDIPERPRDRELAREYSEWPRHHLVF